MFKVKVLYTVTAIESLGFKMSISSATHKLQQDEKFNGFIVDDRIFIPMSNIRAAVLEMPPQVTLYEGHESLTKPEVMAINKPKKNKVANVS